MWVWEGGDPGWCARQRRPGLAPRSLPTAIQAVLRSNGSCLPSVPTPASTPLAGPPHPTRRLRGGRPPSDSFLADHLGLPDLWEQAPPHLPHSPLLPRRPPQAALTRNRPAHIWPWLRGGVQIPHALQGAPAPQSSSVQASAYKDAGLGSRPLPASPLSLSLSLPGVNPSRPCVLMGLHVTHTPGSQVTPVE